MQVKFQSPMFPRFRLLSLMAAVLSLSLSFSCRSPESSPPGEPSTAQPIPTSSPKSSFERDLQFVRNGRFTYVWVFSRPDGKPLDRDDANFLRQTAPQVVDWVATDEGKRVIGGTNFDLEQAGLPALRKRFVVENYTGK